MNFGGAALAPSPLTLTSHAAKVTLVLRILRSHLALIIPRAFSNARRAQRCKMLTHELSSSHRPAKDKAAFYALLPPAVEFVQGSSTGTLVVGHTKLKPINAIPESQTEVRMQHFRWWPLFSYSF